MKKKIAHCIHHTHWDPFWYFTPQDERVVFSYNMKEMLRAFESGEIKDFFFDGQTVAIDLYLQAHPEDREKIAELVKSRKLIIGPFISQLDCYITSGESIVNNLRLGMRNADALGGSSHIAYLADSFGHNYDFPKIFNQFDIHDFVFTRGMGDEYGLGTEFYFKSNDGSKVLCYTLLAGYGYGAYAFKNMQLFSEEAKDYNLIDVGQLIDRLLEKTTVDSEFVFPLGFDQNPIMLGIQEKLDYYNKKFPEYEFKYTSWKDFFARVRQAGRDIKEHDYEILSAQHHRIHKSGMHSARADIKTLQDETERILTFEVQPLMSMLDELGIAYEQGIIDEAWYTLANCQTHASATHPDNTNSWIRENTLIALNLAKGLKQYLVRLAALAVEQSEGDTRSKLVLFNTLPFNRDMVFELKIYTKEKNFNLVRQGENLDYTVIDCVEGFDGVQRLDTNLMDDNKYFYQTRVVVKVPGFKGISYQTIYVEEESSACLCSGICLSDREIENDRYKVTVMQDGIRIIDKANQITLDKAVYFEDNADYGDSYDYSYPYLEKDEWKITYEFDDHRLQTKAYNSALQSKLVLKGVLKLPAGLQSRRERLLDTENEFEIEIVLREDSPVIDIRGKINNRGKNHRLRLVVRTHQENKASYAGTQFGYIKRDTRPLFEDSWREKGYFEEPCGNFPLLNHVSAVAENKVVTIHTRGLKEYDFIQEGYTDIALTVFRAFGHFGLPDLPRRPGRPSGLSSKVLEMQDSQMLCENTFHVGLSLNRAYDGNCVMNEYIKFAASQSYYQNQALNTLAFPTSFFPLNPPKQKLPEQYSFLSVDSENLCFGTLVKALSGKGYILRLYNSEYHEAQGVCLAAGFACKALSRVDLRENVMEEGLSSKIETFAKGGLYNLYFEKKDL